MMRICIYIHRSCVYIVQAANKMHVRNKDILIILLCARCMRGDSYAIHSRQYMCSIAKILLRGYRYI